MGLSSAVRYPLPGAPRPGQVTKLFARPVAVMAALALSAFPLTACGVRAAHNGASNRGNAKATTTQSAAPAGARARGFSGATKAQLLKYAECIRSHGVINFPGPVPAQGGGYAFKITPDANPQSPSPQFLSAEKACQKDVPPSLGGSAPAATSAPGTTVRATVTVDLSKRYQTIAGFGVSEGFGQAKTLMKAPAPVRKQVLSLLFSPTQGAGLTILRNEVSADAGSTIEPKAPSTPKARPVYLSLAQVDQDQGQLWLAKQISADYGVHDLFADAWSAPAFMKTNGSAIRGGTLCGVPGAVCKSGDWRQAYANYLVQYAKDYAAAGLPLTYVGPENETTIAPPQDSMIMSPAQTANFMAVLGATLARSGLPTRAECCASIGWNYAQTFAAAIEADKAANTATAVFTSHGYFVPPGSPLRGWSKPVWETEWAPFGFGPWDPAWDDGSPSSGFTWAQHIYTGLTAADLSAFLYLWGADTAALTGPNTGLVYVKGGTVASSGRLWAFAGYSHFVRPGAVRLGVTSSSTGLEVSAFRNRNGSTAVVVLNTARTGQVATFSLLGVIVAHITPYLTNASHQLSPQAPITVRGDVFSATSPPRSLVTYDIRLRASPASRHRRPATVAAVPRRPGRRGDIATDKRRVRRRTAVRTATSAKVVTIVSPTFVSPNVAPMQPLPDVIPEGAPSVKYSTGPKGRVLFAFGACHS